jgi:hypothetical protein
MPFYTYDQNNSGGSFDFDTERGITTVVIVEAADETEADYRAQRIGLYFDGSGDCRCCGDRWSNSHYGDGGDWPTVYGRPAEEYAESYCWTPDGIPPVYVHYADGRIVGMGEKRK